MRARHAASSSLAPLTHPRPILPRDPPPDSRTTRLRHLDLGVGQQQRTSNSRLAKAVDTAVSARASHLTYSALRSALHSAARTHIGS